MSVSQRREVNWDDIEARFLPPLELRGKVPRRVVGRDKADGGYWARLERGCLSGCLAPLLALGTLMVLWAGLAALMLPFGTRGPAIVTQREPGDGRAATYFLRFRFRAHERVFGGQWPVNSQRWRRTRVGDKITVRYFGFAPGLRPVLEEGLSPWASVFGLGPLGLLLMGVGSVSLLGVVSGRGEKRLAQRGIVTPAVITTNSGDHITFLLRDEDGRVLEVSTRSRCRWEHSGEVVVALHLPGRAAEARLYRDLDWKGASVTDQE